MARTCKSGSAMVMITPITKQTRTRMGSRLVFMIWEPTPSPKGVMDISAPSWKKAMPIISMKAPTRNMAMVPVSMGTMKILSNSTMTVMGTTALMDSSIFSLSFLFSNRFLFNLTSLFL